MPLGRVAMVQTRSETVLRSVERRSLMLSTPFLTLYGDLIASQDSLRH